MHGSGGPVPQLHEREDIGRANGGCGRRWGSAAKFVPYSGEGYSCQLDPRWLQFPSGGAKLFGMRVKTWQPKVGDGVVGSPDGHTVM
jgi:hypothetical protein